LTGLDESRSIAEQLEGLAISIRKMIEDAKAKVEIEFENELNFRWKVDHFQYTDNGITEPKAHADYPTKQTWFRASRKILDQIKQTTAYSDVIEQLRQEFGTGKNHASDLESFVQKIIHKYLYQPQSADGQIDSVVINFIKDMIGGAGQIRRGG
jgi:hypothetical protein